MNRLSALFLVFILLFQKGFSQKKDFSAFWDHKFYMEYSLGVAENFNDARTANYLNPRYMLISLGVAAYLKKIKLSYSFNPVSLKHIKKEFVSPDGYMIKPYNRGFWNSKGSYWINFLRHDISIGYEFKLRGDFSITPAVGFAVTSLQVINDSIHSWKYTAGRSYGAFIDLSARKYFFISDDVAAFIGLHTSAYVSDMNKRFSGLGSSLYTLSVNCGFKFRPTGKGLKLVMGAFINRKVINH